MLAILSAPGSRGDVNPMIGIGRELKRRGFEVVISLAEPYADAAAAAGLQPEPVIESSRFHSLLSSSNFWTPVRGARAVLRTVASEFIDSHYQVIRRWHRRDETVMVAHPLDFASRVFHDADPATPLVDIHLAPAILRMPHAPPRLTPSGIEQTLPAWGVKLGYYLADRWILDPAVAPAIHRLRRDAGLAPVRRPLDRWWFSSGTILAMYPDWFAPAAAASYRQLIHLGFPLEDADDSAFSAPTDRPLVVTGGTANRHSQRFFRLAIEAARELDRTLILLSGYADNFPGTLPAHVRTLAYIPLGKLLPHCAAIVHHGGIGTTSQALAAGIPQLIRPLAFDQFDNADRVQRLGAGSWLRRDRGLAAMLRRLLDERAFADSAQLWSQQIQRDVACQEAATIIAGHLNTGGSG